jgi:YidC/Oxa1 family membrane protein insertase
MQDQKNLIIAISLSLAILLGWNYFYAAPKLEQQKKTAEIAQTAPGTSPDGKTAAPVPGSAAADITLAPTREAALSASPRVTIDSAKIRGSIALKGADFDDIALKDYHETVSKSSPNIIVFTPPSAKDGYFARFGWLGVNPNDLPNAQTVWTADQTKLTEKTPVTLTFDNGKGLVFKRKIAVDEDYMFTVTDRVENTSGTELKLTPYGFIRRVGTPFTEGYYILHEGLLGVFGEQGLKELTYANLEKEPNLSTTDKGKDFKASQGGWAGFTDKYWASAIVPDQKVAFDSTLSMAMPAAPNAPKVYQTFVTQPTTTVATNGTTEVTTRLFVGAKEVNTLNDYENSLGIKQFKLMIDWGWFWFITQPLFRVLDLIFKFTGNFGIAILVVTVLVKAVFYPLANKSYSSMAKMKAVQPQMMAIRERFADDRVKQQQELMDLYKKEKINPLAGCLPILIQIPVFFALYKVLFVTIEMRHAPFFGWIKDLAAPDPTSMFNLFGLLPFAVPAFLLIGVWPIIMGITMFVQMKMNPEPTDPIQKTMFTWMPVIFTFMLASFPAGLVIYWSWNNFLSILQQYAIMKKQGVKVELWDNLRSMTKRPEKSS